MFEDLKRIGERREAHRKKNHPWRLGGGPNGKHSVAVIVKHDINNTNLFKPTRRSFPR